MRQQCSNIKNFIFKQKCIPYRLKVYLDNERKSKAKKNHSVRLNRSHLLNSSAEVYSFDIFDTVLTRSSGVPVSIFALMENQLKNTQQETNLPLDLIENFSNIRKDSEQQVRRLSKLSEIQFIDIYNHISKTFNLTEQQTRFLKELELDTEYKMLTPITETIELIKHFKSKSKTIIYISDMYLPKLFIEKVLLKTQIFEQSDKIFLSCELNKTKHGGDIFPHVLQTLQLKGRDIIHIGDNYRSDVLKAREHGINGFHLNVTNLSHVEEAYLIPDLATSTTHLIQHSIVAASRLARMSLNSNSTQTNKLFEIGASIAGPMLFSYVNWILLDAKARRLKSLYFIARDGQILFEIAKVLEYKLKTGIQLHYMYGSRQSWRLPSITEIDESEMKWILNKNPILSISMIAKRLEISPELVQHAIKEECRYMFRLDEAITGDKREELKIIFQRADILAAVEKSSNIRRQLVLDYFKQEQMFNQNPWAIVDIGWHGSLQVALRKLIDLAGRPDIQIHGYFFGLRDTAKLDSLTHSSYSNYLLEPSTWGKGPYVDNGVVNLLEIFTAANHGLTLGYECVDDTIKPILKDLINKPVIQWGLADLRTGVFAFGHYMKENNVPLEVDSPLLKESFKKVLTEFLENPTREEASVIGQHPFSSDQAETYTRVHAPAFTCWDAFRYGWSYDKHSFSCWYKGSYLQSSIYSKLILTKKVQLLIRTIRNVYQKKIGGLKRYTHATQ